jgi:hypothetical protein
MATQRKPAVKKAPAAKKATAAKKAPAASKKKTITEEDIRKRAEIIYNNRIAKGIPGTPESDWMQAEKELKG